MNLIDTHAHLTFKQLYKDVDSVLARSIEAGVDSWITISTEPAEISRVLELVEKHENMYAALGYHPHDAKSITLEDMELLRRSLGHEKVVAIGETGLDFFYEHSPHDVQRDIFRRHLQIASELNKPVVVHTRNAFDESMEVLDEFTGKLNNVVIHCYSGTPEQTRYVLDKGYFISFTGIVTFKKSDEVRAAVKLVPIERMMVETDCPFISPEPVRNQRPCEPAFLIHTAKKLAEIKEIEFKKFCQQVTTTSKNFFRLEQA